MKGRKKMLPNGRKILKKARKPLKSLSSGCLRVSRNESINFTLTVKIERFFHNSLYFS
ncbi:hypothetical protein J2Z42_002177 [Clostridium algifaecis]|uniref:Uncharacterized protein n=1 Tax=Clostridium algifaecis TaxID=1472040 RepID=A0ABS4KX41_9CLOT|nr:hypothetical protein [Clostridium algifaecis]